MQRLFVLYHHNDDWFLVFFCFIMANWGPGGGSKPPTGPAGFSAEAHNDAVRERVSE